MANHQIAGKFDTAIYIWEDYKRFLSEHSDLADSEEEYDYYMNMADGYLEELTYE